MTLALWAVAIAIVILAASISKGMKIMAVDYSLLSAAFVRLADEVANLADKIADPQVDTASQEAADAFAAKLNTISDGLRGLADEEHAMDTAGAIVASADSAAAAETGGGVADVAVTGEVTGAEAGVAGEADAEGDEPTA